MFSERALIRWRNHLRSDGATTFSEVEGGLNSMTIGRFERLVSESDFKLDFIEPVPIRKLRRVHTKITREFTTAIVRCRMTKPAMVAADARPVPVRTRRPAEVEEVRVRAARLGVGQPTALS